MMDIQKKLILGKLVSALGHGKKTRTNLKRNLGFPEAEVENAIEFGTQCDVLRVLAQGYVELIIDNKPIVEADYYPCIEYMLEKHYRDRVTKDGRYCIAKTARRDSRVAGRWTRPDFTVVTSRKFPYIHQPEFDIITFEVKRPADCGALAVFEALAHNSAATRSYVFFPVTEIELANNDQGERIREECVRHGIGLFLACDSYKLDEAHLVIESQRRPLNPEKCSHFLQSVLDSNELSRLTTWA